ncbi:MAG: GNAT family N-acetyltransferase [Proteobacteria bacterium]|nr:GNAT family N-acetyltransferase [Pseudomonadota bacterium]
MTLDRPKPSGRFSPDRLFLPDSVAVIGAGTEAGLRVMANLMAADFKGAILPVEAGSKAVRGILAYPDSRSLPIAPDLAVVAGSVASLSATLSDLVSRGCFAAVLTGIAPDLGREDLPQGLRVLGPGSFGIAIPRIGLNATQSHRPVVAGRLALVSQSASLCRTVLDWSEPNGVGFSHIVGIGGNLDIGFGMVLDWLSRDPGTGTILLDIRQIRDRRAFLSAARAAARLRPVVAIRAGGLLLDPTGAADLAFEAALRRAGILFVSRIDDMLAAAETLARSKPVRHEAIAIVTNAVGPGRFAADAAIADGLSLVAFTSETEARLRAKLPDFPERAGGLVHVAPDRPALFAEVAALLAEAPEVGGVLMVHAPVGPADEATIEALAAAGRGFRVPLLAAVLGESTARPLRQRLAEAGLPVFASPEQAARGFRHLVQNRRNRAAAAELPPSTVLSVAPDRADVRRQIDHARACDQTELSEEVALSVLSGYGVPIVPARGAMSAGDAADAAVMLGFPVVLKLRREKGRLPGQRAGIVLDVSTADEARRVADALLRRAAAGHSRLSPLIVQRRVGRARELRIRVWIDPMFGPVIGFGLGGSAGADVGDMAADLPPLNLPLAQGLIARSRAAMALAGRPEQPAANLQAVAECLVRVSQLIVDFPEIASMEINPIFADGDGVLVADVAIALHPFGTPAPPLAISPYPMELIERWNSKGETITVRPIRPEDAEEHGAFFRRLSPEDVRFRFFSSVRALSPEQVARLTQVDYDREMAFIAQRESTGETIGVARLVVDLARRSGEFAVIVQPDMKGRGLASHLMHRALDWGRSRGLVEVVGQVLADNAPMLSFVRHLGFTIRRLPEEPDVVEARYVFEPGAM